MTTQDKQGFYIIGQFDRVFQKRRKDNDGRETVSDHVGLLVRTDSGTLVVSVKTKRPQLYAQYKRDDVVKIRVEVGAYNNYVFYQDETCHR